MLNEAKTSLRQLENLYKQIKDEKAKTSPTASSNWIKGQPSTSEVNKLCLPPPPIRMNQGRSPFRSVINRDAMMICKTEPFFDHNPEGPFVAQTYSQNNLKRPHLKPHFANSIPTVSAVAHVPEPDRSLLRQDKDVGDLTFKPIKEKQHPPCPSNSSCSRSSQRSIRGSPIEIPARDEQIARPVPRSKKRQPLDALVMEGCLLTRREIVQMTIDEFNELLEKSGFSEEQKVQLRDCRRKEKNKANAKISRQKRSNTRAHFESLLERKEAALADAKTEHSLYKNWNANLAIGLEMAERKRRIQILILQEKMNKGPSSK